jgi:hypothetical protein
MTMSGSTEKVTHVGDLDPEEIVHRVKNGQAHRVESCPQLQRSPREHTSTKAGCLWDTTAVCRSCATGEVDESNKKQPEREETLPTQTEVPGA